MKNALFNFLFLYFSNVEYLHEIIKIFHFSLLSKILQKTLRREKVILKNHHNEKDLFLTGKENGGLFRIANSRVLHYYAKEVYIIRKKIIKNEISN